MSLWGTGLVLHEVSLIAERVAPVVHEGPFGQEALVFELAKQLRAAMLDLEAAVIASTIQTGCTDGLQRHSISNHPPARYA